MLNLKDKFSRRIDELTETHTAHIVSGGCENHADYKLVVGKLAGLEQARQEFQEIWEKFTRQADED